MSEDVRILGTIATAGGATAMFGVSHNTHLAEFFVLFFLLLFILGRTKLVR